MMRKELPIWIPVVLAISPLNLPAAPASAMDFTIEELWGNCQVLVEKGILDKPVDQWDLKSPDDAGAAWSCVGYMMAATVSVAGYSRLDGVPQVYCAPGAKLNEAIRVFVRWAAANPEQHQQTAMVGVFLALGEAWPCEDSTPEEGGRQ